MKTDSHSHTPGPWTIDQHNDVNGPDTGFGELRVATIESTARREQKANARLIAAAPDMLEALRAAERAHEIHANCDDCMEGANDPVSCERCIKSWTIAYDLRQAAIAKATGGQGHG